MSFAFRICRRCGLWHDATVACELTAALQAYFTVTPKQQAGADAAERSAIVRYLLRPRP